MRAQEFDVVERKFTIHEVTDAIKEGRMIESFGAGTAAVVSPVQLIHFAGTDYKVCFPCFIALILSECLIATLHDQQNGPAQQLHSHHFLFVRYNFRCRAHRCR